MTSNSPAALVVGDSSPRVMIQNLLPRLAEEVGSSAPVMEILLEYMDEVGGTPSSFMAEKFHPTPGADFLPSMMRNIKWFCRKTGYTEFPSEHTPKVIRDWMEGAFGVAGIIGVTGFVRTTNKEEEKKHGAKTSGDRSAWSYGYMEETRCTSRKTCVAKFSLIPHRQWKEGKSLKYYPDRNRAIKFLSKLCGRLHVWSDPWLTAKSLPIAKTGLVSVLADRFVIEMCGSWDSFVAKYPATYALMAICCSVFSERKEFTLKAQKQGSLNPHMHSLYRLVRETEPAGLKVVALFLPTWEVFSSVSVEDATVIYQTSMVWLGYMARFLDEQWKKGVAKCVRRLCRVPPRGTKVNSSGYNAVADAWMNLRRFQTVAAKRASIEMAPVILKVMQLIADDQFRWGDGKTDPNAAVYKAITSAGVLPWMAVLRPESFDSRAALTAVVDGVRAHGSSVDSWIGIARTRFGETSVPVDMICGCAVPNMSPECAEFLQELGVFGARPWTGT